MNQQSPLNRPEHFTNFRAIDINDAFAFTKQTWKDHGPSIVKQIIPSIAVLAFLKYILSAMPIVIGLLPFSFISDLSSIAVSLILFPFNLALTIVLQALIFGMYRPVSQIVLHGALPAGESFLSMARQNFFSLVILSAAATAATSFGICFLVIPGLIIGIVAQPTAYLVATRGMGMVDAVKASIEVIKSNLIPVLAYHAIFAAIASVLAVPLLILLFGAAFALNYVSPTLAAFFPAGMTAGFCIIGVPIYVFVLGSLYTKLIDAPQTAAQPAVDNLQPPTQQAW